MARGIVVTVLSLATAVLIAYSGVATGFIIALLQVAA